MLWKWIVVIICCTKQGSVHITCHFSEVLKIKTPTWFGRRLACSFSLTVFVATKMIVDTRHNYSTVVNCDPVSSTTWAIIQLQLTCLRFASILHSMQSCIMQFAWRSNRAWLNVLHVRGRRAAEVWSHLCTLLCKTWLRRVGGGLQTLLTSAPVFTVHWRADWRLLHPLVWFLNEILSWLFPICWASTTSSRPIWLCELVAEGKLCNSWMIVITRMIVRSWK